MEIPLPPTEIRQGGGPLKYDDDYFMRTAREDVEFLGTVGLEQGHHLVDFGSGPGRIAVGLIASGWAGSYIGVELNHRHVAWASAELTPHFPDFRFVQVDAAHARYNPAGSQPHRLPIKDGWADMICAFSVFSHMPSDQSKMYLAEFQRGLAPGGKAFITAYVADDVPDETENPESLGEWSGRLHCVLYSTNYLASLVKGAGLTMEIIPRAERKQTGLVLSRHPST